MQKNDQAILGNVQMLGIVVTDVLKDVIAVSRGKDTAFQTFMSKFYY